MSALSAPWLLDGAHGEGGGGLLHTVLALSALTQQPVRIQGVRGASSMPGLSAEDLTLLRPLALCCEAKVEGAELRSPEITFSPSSRPRSLNELIDVYQPSEGSGEGFANALLVSNALLPVLARAGAFSSVVVRGETHGHRILSFDYFANATVVALRRFGLYAFPEIVSAGFGRGSAGEIKLEVEPSALSGVDWSERGELRCCRAIVVTAQVGETVGDRGVSHLERLAHNADVPIQTEWVEVPSKGSGAFATVWAEFERGMGGATAMGRRGVRIEAVAQQAFEGFQSWLRSGATVDQHLADQILLAAAIAEGETEFTVDRLTQRFLTMAWAIKQLLPIRLVVRGQEGVFGEVHIRR